MIDVVVRIIETLFNFHALRWELLVAGWLAFVISVARFCGLNTRREQEARQQLARELHQHTPPPPRPRWSVEPDGNGRFHVHHEHTP